MAPLSIPRLTQGEIMPRNTRLSTASRSLTDTFRNTLLATCAGLAFMAPALADTEGDPVDDGPIARGTPPEGGTIVYTTWQPERRTARLCL